MAEQTIMVPAGSPAAMLRQAGMLLGIAASVALGVWVVLWSRTPPYSLLFADMADRDLSAVVDTLQATAIPYKVDHASGALLVAADRVHEARMKLAAAGLPRSAGMGYELLEQDQGFGTSQFLENARFQRALEGELSRSISRLQNVRSARVHLAMPKDTVFMRERPEPSASVLVDLFPGRSLEREQVGAITHLVSASVPNLRLANVTVVDQLGRLLNAEDDDPEMAASTRRLDYTRRVEHTFVSRIEQILAPIVGHDGVKAQVTAELDFTSVEKTSERFNPDLPSVRSEQTLEERRSGGGPGGIPGALSNQPPADADVPEVADGGGEGAGASTDSVTGDMRTQKTRNYELDKTISHTKLPTGSIRRLSVAVVVNNKSVVGDDGKLSAVPLDEAELERVRGLVKDAVGFDAARGDTVNVINTAFNVPIPAEPLPEPPIWEQPWVWSAGKQVVGALFVLIALFGVIRPAMRNLMRRETVSAEELALATANQAALPRGEDGDDEDSGAPPKQLKAPVNAEVESIKNYVNQEPKLAAQVVKGWVNQE